MGLTKKTIGRIGQLATCAAAMAVVAAGEARAGQGSDNPAETSEQREVRMKSWREAKLGMFIHWGVYAQTGGVWGGEPVQGWSEWMMLKGKIPVDDYLHMASAFDPEQFNADQWVAIAKRAGMKYMVFTAKHHDGFAMYPSKASPYNIAEKTPFKRDPVGELAEACKKGGIKFGLYYSQAQDWLNGGSAEGGHWDPKQERDMDEYIRDVAVPQIRELLTQYGPIVEWWWDAPVGMTGPRSKLLGPLPKSIQPQIVTNNRVGGGGPEGDMMVSEGRVPVRPIRGKDWETCMTMNGSWGFKAGDTNYKSEQTLIRTLVDIVSKGGNFLLNVSPDGTGVIPAEQVNRLAAVGKWMEVNGESIYGAGPSPFDRRILWGKITQKPGKVYLHVFTWQPGQSILVRLKNKVRKAYLLSDPKRNLAAETTEQGVSVKLEGSEPDAAASVVVLELEGEIDPLPPAPIASGENGTLLLAAVDVDFVDQREAVLDGPEEKASIGNWKNPQEHVEWKAQIDKPGKYRVSATYGASNASGETLAISSGASSVSRAIENTGDRMKFQENQIGILTLSKGVQTIEAKISGMAGRWNLQSISLVPQD